MGILSNALIAQVEKQSASIATIELDGTKHLLGTLPLTPADFDAINTHISKKMKMPFYFQNNANDFTGQIRMVVRKARVVTDEENKTLGDKAFDATDIPRLDRLGVEVISEIFFALFGEQMSEEDSDLDEEDGSDEDDGDAIKKN